MQRIFLVPVIIVLFFLSLEAQEPTTQWDNTVKKNRPENFVPVEIQSSSDGKIQNAIFHKTPLQEPQPLIVSLHTWSGNYLQEDPLANEVMLRGWNYIHPNFRGPNNRPEACGSQLVISDIEDAIRFAVKNGNVDKNEIHIIGVSGGGYAALVAFMKQDYPVKSFSAWAPISNLEDWYWETTGRKLKYARDLENVTTGGTGFDADEARKRSPVLMDFPAGKRKNASLFIYTGVHDGYTGSVPVTHSVNMFNHIAAEMSPDNRGQIIPDSLKLVLLEKRMNPGANNSFLIGGRKVHLYREAPQISLVIFEGGHEMLAPQALTLIPVNKKRNTEKYNILTIGDSNGASKIGWPVQLRKLLPFSIIINKSIPGNTIGFDNLGNQSLNTLRNINRYLNESFDSLNNNEQLDYIIIGLGTNDTKRIFIGNQNEVSQNLSELVSEIKQYIQEKNKKMPKIIVMSAPPMDEKKLDNDKYGGGDKRISDNNIDFLEVTKKQNVVFIDIYSALKKNIQEYTIDGVHLKEKAQFLIAKMISNKITSD